MKRIVLLGCLFLTSPVIALTPDVPERVDISKLVISSGAFVGKQASFHGCLVNVTPHGQLVRPCHSQSSDLIIVSDDTFGRKGPFLALVIKTKSLSRCVQANFSGLVSSSEVVWPRKRLETTIKLTSFSNVARCPT
jgi:hypothetical protein